MNKGKIFLIFGLVLLLILMISLFLWIFFRPKSEKKINKQKQSNIKQSNITDCGYLSKTRGWYDIDNEGVRNDYCRWVGNSPNPPEGWFSCAMAGTTDSYTPKSEEISDTLPHDNLKPGDPCYS